MISRWTSSCTSSINSLSRIWHPSITVTMEDFINMYTVHTPLLHTDLKQKDSLRIGIRFLSVISALFTSLLYREFQYDDVICHETGSVKLTDGNQISTKSYESSRTMIQRRLIRSSHMKLSTEDYRRLFEHYFAELITHEDSVIYCMTHTYEICRRIDWIFTVRIY